MFSNLIEKSIILKDLPQGKYKHFSFILRRNKILSIGWNQMWKTHPWALKYGFSYGFPHSEVMAIKNFPYPVTELRHCKLINVRLIKNNSLALSRPCVTCIKLLSIFEIGEVYFSTDKGFNLL